MTSLMALLRFSAFFQSKSTSFAFLQSASVFFVDSAVRRAVAISIYLLWRYALRLDVLIRISLRTMRPKIKSNLHMACMRHVLFVDVFGSRSEDNSNNAFVISGSWSTTALTASNRHAHRVSLCDFSVCSNTCLWHKKTHQIVL